MFFLIPVFLLGIAIGSFINAVVYRLNVGEDFIFKRSHCPNCGHVLSWKDLIPVFSFLILKGSCRYCQKPISWQYPIIESITGILFLLIFCLLPAANPLVIAYTFLITSFLLIIVVYDLKYYLIPDKVIYPAIAISFFVNIFIAFQRYYFSDFSRAFGLIINGWLASLLASGFFLAIVLFSKEKWMGWGDVKLAIFMGLILGLPNILVALFVAFLSGAIIGIGLIVLKRKNLKSEVPFGPFLAAGTFVALVWGERIVGWYLGLFS